MPAAAAAWDELAAELHSAAGSYQSVVSGLTTGLLRGPSSVSMASAVAPYVAWTAGAGPQADEAAAQARAAAGAYEAAFAMTVPPPVATENRVRLVTLIATDFLGQNSPAIAATEAEYVEMWAQGAAAMYRYAASSARGFGTEGIHARPAGHRRRWGSHAGLYGIESEQFRTRSTRTSGNDGIRFVNFEGGSVRSVGSVEGWGVMKVVLFCGG